jgi:hypothetical protein
MLAATREEIELYYQDPADFKIVEFREVKKTK